MIPFVLLDPELIAPEPSHDQRTLTDFWLRFAEWIDDDRTRLGARSFELLSTLYARLNQPEYVPAPIRRTVSRSVGIILARQPLLHEESESKSVLTQRYGGKSEYRQILIDDLVGTADHPFLAVGTDPDFWSDQSDIVGCLPPPPSSRPLHFAPGMPTVEERLLAMRNWFAGRRIVVIGGQIDLNIQADIVSSCGIDPGLFKWIPSEYNKKASNVSNVIAGLPLDMSIVICITGKVGHSTSKAVEAACQKSGLQYNFVQHASGISMKLTELYETRAA